MSQEALVEVLEEARALLGDPANDFAWSRWKNEKQAVAEIDGSLKTICVGGTIRLDDLALLFAPTASLQDVSISSGWGDAFVDLSARFDAAIQDL